MNTINRTSIALILPLLVSFTGCLDEKVKTVINPDGSSQRTISMKLRSKSVPEKAFPSASGLWQTEWKESGDTSAPYEYRATRSISTPGEFHCEYSVDDSSRAMRIEASVEKRFQWFYTYIDYTEKYTFKNPFGNLPVTDYLSPDEIERFQRGEEAESLKSKVQLWIESDKFEELFSNLTDYADKTNDPEISSSFLLKNKERLARHILNEDSTWKEDKSTADSGGTEERIFNRISTIVFGHKISEKLQPAVARAIGSIQSKEKLILFPDSWEYTTAMPGLLVESNGQTITGSSVTWKFTPDQAKVAPYVMMATSRIVNLWAFILSGALLLLLVLISLVPVLRRRVKKV